MEIQKRYLSDLEAEFQEKLLSDRDLFFSYAWAYAKEEEGDSFLEWSFKKYERENRKEAGK